MDTKLKNNTQHKTLIKKAALIICMPILIALLMLLARDYHDLKRSWPTDSDNKSSSYYIDKDGIISDEIIRYAKNLNRFYIYYYHYDVLSDEEKITAADLDEKSMGVRYELIQAVSEIEASYNEKILDSYHIDYSDTDAYLAEVTTVGADSYELVDDMIVTFRKYKEIFTYDISLYEEKLNKIEEAKERLLPAEEEIKTSILKEKEANYNAIKNYLTANEDYQYYIVNTRTKEVFTNAEQDMLDQYEDIKDFLQQETFAYVNIIEDNLFQASFNGVPLKESFLENNMEGYVFIPLSAASRNAPVYSRIQGIDRINRQNADMRGTAFYLLIVLIAMLVCLIVYVFRRGQKEFIMLTGKVTSLYNKLPLTVKGFLCLLSFFSIFYVMDYRIGAIVTFFYGVTLSDLLSLCITAVWMAAAIVFMFAAFMYLIYIVRNIKGLLNEFEIKTLFIDIDILKHSGHHFIYFLFNFMIFLFITGSLFILFVTYINIRSMRFIFLELTCLAAAFLIMCLMVKYMTNQIKYSYYLEEMIKGNTDVFAQETGFFSNKINKLQGLNDNIKKIVDEQLRGEKLKTELITNVSHDLKTPLTSIISYLDILKEDALPKEKYLEFIDILDKKAYRLKILIEDLFEISKLASGQVNLSFETVDIVDLLKQTLGELDEKIRQANVTFKFYTEKDHILMRLDGKKMWRVFENLINNIIKYSKEGTRAYIDIKSNEDNVTITMKNISDLEMNFASDELFERFKRGDSARSTEGSGLGLSIAKSIVELHGGKLQIEIDGDLFKIIIILAQ